MMRRIIGIDPGKDGGYVVLTPEGDVVEVYHLDDGLKILATMSRQDAQGYHAFVEKAQVMAKGPVRPSAVASFTYGTGYGEILGLLRGLWMPYTLVSPGAWTRTMHQGTTVTKADKVRSFEAAGRIFPRQTWILTGRRKPHDGTCEAALIAEWGRRHLGGSESVAIPF
jgi:crossover junction endodeoxyribonuclease RuvC